MDPLRVTKLLEDVQTASVPVPAKPTVGEGAPPPKGDKKWEYVNQVLAHMDRSTKDLNKSAKGGDAYQFAHAMSLVIASLDIIAKKLGIDDAGLEDSQIAVMRWGKVQPVHEGKVLMARAVRLLEGMNRRIGNRLLMEYAGAAPMPQANKGMASAGHALGNMGHMLASMKSQAMVGNTKAFGINMAAMLGELQVVADALGMNISLSGLEDKVARWARLSAAEAKQLKPKGKKLAEAAPTKRVKFEITMDLREPADPDQIANKLSAILVHNFHASNTHIKQF